jgi:hypothetical protein
VSADHLQAYLNEDDGGGDGGPCVAPPPSGWRSRSPGNCAPIRGPNATANECASDLSQKQGQIRGGS